MKKCINGEWLSEEEAFDRHKGLIRLVCGRLQGYARRNDIEWGDLWQEASLAFVQAYRKYDPTRGVMFSTYAVRTITFYLLKYIERSYRKKVVSVSLDVPADEKERHSILDVIGREGDYTGIDVREFVETLTPDEKEVLRLTAAGIIQTEIGRRIGANQVKVSRILKQVRRKYMAYKEAEHEPIA
ncbi:sigma-70 family RNA polymerase sigma factor [Geobacillus subterraneus]|uniref:sigma-70 family RNA polymerase sigma factor n=1 Tax=Geobacillus subterraneus TaxID=129338 RepID=UPI002AC8C63B|nr:sigma-70 family RNA polymerase sigma factor [Geobacillus subterraneus]WPZ17831.1 sigma-70 family RNA polymerase sigma factor [Geobacillus subterraneus]